MRQLPVGALPGRKSGTAMGIGSNVPVEVEAKNRPRGPLRNEANAPIPAARRKRARRVNRERSPSGRGGGQEDEIGRS